MIVPNRDIEFLPDDTILWRYMSLENFLYLLNTQTLHFHRIDSFSDSKEGELSLIDKKLFHLENDEEFWNKERKQNYINCWIMSSTELSLMWECYAKNGIAIKTTVLLLKKSLAKDKEHHINIGAIRYIDIDGNGTSQDEGKPQNFLKCFFVKRKYFCQEKECRLLYSHYDNQAETPKGYDFPIDITTLIKEVVISPYASNITNQVVHQAIESSKLNLKICKSKI